MNAGVPMPDIEVPLREQYGQLSEDVIVDSLLTAWAERTGTDLKDHRYLEIGANHPFGTSSSYLLHRLHGMTGVLVEANADLLDALALARPADEVVSCAVTANDASEVEFFISNLSELSSLSREFVEEWQDGAAGLAEIRKVPAMRVNALLEHYFADQPPVFFSIDVEGMDMDILRDMDWRRWRPVVVQTEPSDHFVADQSKSIIRFMHDEGYTLVARTSINLIFMDRNVLTCRLEEPQEGDAVPAPTAPFIAPKHSYSDTVSVGIVTRTKNRGVLLRRALESVKHQTYPHWQLVVINDGGEPGPVDYLVGAIFGGDARVRVVHHPASVGMEAASNAGLARLHTDLAIIHDDDDSWAPDMLAVSTGVLRQRNASMPSVRGVVTCVNQIHETVTANHIQIETVHPFNEHSPDKLREGLISLPRLAMQNLYPPIAFLFDLSLARKLGGFDANLPVLGDWDFNLRFCQEADIWVHPERLAFYHHRQNATGDLGNTVIHGLANHRLYNVYLRNKLLRSTDSPLSAAMVLLREQGLELQALQNKLEGVHQEVNQTSHAVVQHMIPMMKKALKGRRSKLGAFLSELNRKRKRLRKSRRRETHE